jgi:hypothetical protein
MHIKQMNFGIRPRFILKRAYYVHVNIPECENNPRNNLKGDSKMAARGRKQKACLLK